MSQSYQSFQLVCFIGWFSFAVTAILKRYNIVIYCKLLCVITSLSTLDRNIFLIKLDCFVCLSSVRGDVSRLCQVSPQPSCWRHLLGTDCLMGQPQQQANPGPENPAVCRCTHCNAPSTWLHLPPTSTRARYTWFLLCRSIPFTA